MLWKIPHVLTKQTHILVNTPAYCRSTQYNTKKYKNINKHTYYRRTHITEKRIYITETNTHIDESPSQITETQTRITEKPTHITEKHNTD